MEWNYKYKHHTIMMAGMESRMFKFRTADGGQYFCDSLDGAMKLIDELMADYYNMTREQYKQLLSKLTDREKDFVDAMLWELHDHEDSAYCDLGVNIFFNLPEIGLD